MNSRSGFKWSWVETLAVVFLVTALITVFFGDLFFGQRQPGDNDNTAYARAIFAPLTVLMFSVPLGGAGVALLFVRPLLRLDAKVLPWLIPLFGIALVAGTEPVCEISDRSGGPQSSLCGIIAYALSGMLILLGAVALIRKYQLPKQADSKTGEAQQ
jgi:hypothetical protein